MMIKAVTALAMALVVGSANALQSAVVTRNSTVSEVSARIVGGTIISPKTRQYMAAMILEEVDSGTQYLCGSSYIGSSGGYHYMLTAGHCIPSGSFYAVAMFLRDDLQEYDSDSFNLVQGVGVEVHPDYVEESDGSTQNDLSIIYFSDTNVDLPTSVLLAGSLMTMTDGENATVTGYGTTSYGGTTDYELRQAKINIVDIDECASDYGNSFDIEYQYHVCAAASGKDSCQGDSGGPLTVAPVSEEIQVGIVAFGYGCAYDGYPGVYTRVSSYESWIREIVTSTSPTADDSSLRFYASNVSNATFAPTASPTIASAASLADSPTPYPTNSPSSAMATPVSFGAAIVAIFVCLASLI
ncbi:Serine protease 29 [Hondaea fermentalgiana]|uniref:Serine protease 29 n=1 Tax=Hondaea fermentalgiana TaxID=2315210 RepID=A0A2R5G9G8_9STRA|nr:Serine protease 29 [Hondaea fermentalgiana]|eukprot:GBG27677.1 Serine protease 29 [Hondaea fermentalgiana]